MSNSKGFTLLEILAVLLIVGILAAVGVHKFIKLDNSAATIVLQNAVVQFNDTEKHHWANEKLSETYISDDQIFELVKADLIVAYNWQEISSTGGLVNINSNIFKVERQPSTNKGYAIWKEVPSGG